MIQKTKKTEKAPIRPPWEEIFSSFGDGLIVLGADRNILGINSASESITGLSAEVVLGHPLEEAFAKNAELLSLLRPAIEEGRALTLREIPWKRVRHVRPATVDLSVTPLFGEEGDLNGWILVLRDISPVKDLQEEIRKTDRLAMLGTIAAGLAHEIKNPLGGIRGAAQLLEREKLSDESMACLKIVTKEVDRIDRMVRQLLLLGRPRDLTLEPVNINELLESLLLLQKVPFELKGIRLFREFDPSLPPVWGDADELRQAFLNFLQNALEAVPTFGGTIRIRSRMVTDFAIRGTAGRRASRFVMVEIQDNGEGISEEDLTKIFTPFFSTKKSGSGLGLAIAQRVVNEHGGMLKVQSHPGEGTTVQTTLRSSL